MTQALYAHMNNKTIKIKKNSVVCIYGNLVLYFAIDGIWVVYRVFCYYGQHVVHIFLYFVNMHEFLFSVSLDVKVLDEI
jgi:hypothetical protein